MKIFSKLSFKSFAAFGAAALVVSSAFAASWSSCDGTCKNYAAIAYTNSKPYYATQQTNYCNTLTDPNAKSACLASVPAYSEQQAQATSTNVYNQCMQSCTQTP
jgi:hypothetical protein